MSSITQSHSVNPAGCTPAELVIIAARLLEVAAQLAQPITISAPKYITTKEALVMYDMGEAALQARHIRRVKKGRAWAWLVEDIEACLANGAQPATPRTRKAREIPAENEDVLSAMVRRGELRAVRGGR